MVHDFLLQKIFLLDARQIFSSNYLWNQYKVAWGLVKYTRNTY